MTFCAASETPCADVKEAIPQESMHPLQAAEDPTLGTLARRLSAKLCRQRFDVDLQNELASLNSFSIFSKVDSADVAKCLDMSRATMLGARAIGAMVGMAIGDACGAPLEFLAADQGRDGFCGCQKRPRFDAHTMRHHGAYNRFGLKPGQWTDDTSMSLCIADSLLACHGYDGADIRVRFWCWWYRDYNNAFRFDETRSASVGLGQNISKSLKDVRSSSPNPRYDVAGDDAGNGSLMRLAPIPIYFHTDENVARRMSAESSYTTHPGPLAADACAFLGFLIARALARQDVELSQAGHFIDACVEAYLQLPDVGTTQATLARLLLSNEPIGSKERCWNWRDPEGPYILETLRARGHWYNGYPNSASYFGSFCLDGLAIALHCVYHTSSFIEAIECCVNFLGDADSTGAICGQIAGAFYGVGNIDPRFIAQLEHWDHQEIALRGALLASLGPSCSDLLAGETSSQVLYNDKRIHQAHI